MARPDTSVDQMKVVLIDIDTAALEQTTYTLRATGAAHVLCNDAWSWGTHRNSIIETPESSVQLDPVPIVHHRGRRQQRSLLADVAEHKALLQRDERDVFHAARQHWARWDPARRHRPGKCRTGSAADRLRVSQVVRPRQPRLARPARRSAAVPAGAALAACDTDRPGAEAHSSGASGIWER
jgi:hypothetical protein